jgi:PAS domain S-box-containing protein
MHLTVHSYRLPTNESLLINRQLLDLALKSGEIGIWQLDLTNQKLEWDEQALKIFGQTKESFTGHISAWEDALHPQDKEFAREKYSEFLTFEQPLDINFRIIQPSGAVRHIRARAKLIKDKYGKPVKALGTNWDITRYRKEHEQLKLAKLVIEHAKDTIIICDAEPLDAPEPQITYVNPAFEQEFGWTAEEVIGKSPRMFASPRAEPGQRVELRKQMEKWESARADLLNRSKNGLDFWTELDLFPVNNETGRCTHWVAIQRNISRRKELEASIAKAQAAEQKHIALKTKFIANMSHEIRTPMNGIMGMATLAQHYAGTDRAAEYIKHIQISSKALIRILDDVLEYATLESGNAVIIDEPLSFKAICENLDKTFQHMAVEKRIKFECKIQSGIPIQLVGDQIRVQQVLSNLVNNAIKFTDQGEITVSIGLVDIKENTCTIHIAVKDTGIGISASKLSCITNEFTQADPAISRKYGGSGLGLAISKQVLGLMGSTLQIESTEGLGSTFSFDIELKANHQPAFKSQRQDVHDTASLDKIKENIGLLFQQKSILIVDDDTSNALTLKDMFEVLKIKSDIASNGKNAISLINENTYDLVLMDIHMAEIDGVTATEHIRQTKDKSQLPIIAVTADITPKQRTECLEKGMNAVLLKPFEISKLIESILIVWNHPDSSESS